MSFPKLLAWNCRGARSKRALSHLHLLISYYRLDIVILMEPRCSSDVLHGVLANSCLTDFVVAEARGFFGGIWILWNAQVVHIDPISIDDQIINAVVWTASSPPWLLSAVYASPLSTVRQHLWDYLLQMGNCVELPWLMIGDFNQVIHPSEKHGGLRPSTARMNAFLEVIHCCAMIDLGYSGPRYTWSNLRPGPAHVQERLDRALGNHLWVASYPDCVVTHTPRTRSDHHPLILRDSNSSVRPRHSGPFKIQDAWFRHPHFEPFLLECWLESGSLGLVQKLDLLRQDLQRWNRSVFGNIFDRKFRCLARLAGVQKALQQHRPERLLLLEEQLRLELDEILCQEAVFWRQKSQVSWLQDGERNTRFFHTSTLIR